MRKNKRSRSRRFAMILLSLAVVLAYAVPPVFAASTGDLMVSFTYKDGSNTIRINGGQFDLYRVGDIDSNGKVTSYTDTFQPYADSIPELDNSSPDEDWREVSVTMAGYVSANQSAQPDQTKVTGSNGRTVFPKLSDGRYLVVGHPVTQVIAGTDGAEINRIYTPAPFLVDMRGENRTAIVKMEMREYPTNTQIPITTTQTVRKIWVDEGNENLRPTSISVDLWQMKYDKDGNFLSEEPLSVVLNNANGWRHTWEELPYVDVDGSFYEYQAEESAPPTGYTVITVPEGETGFKITNTYKPPKPDEPGTDTPGTVSRAARKVWDDEGYENKRPESIQVQLLKDGQPDGDPVTLNESNNWEVKWTNLTDKSEWTVKEVSAPKGYTSSTETIQENQTRTLYVFTNSYKPPTPPPGGNKTDLTVQKVWKDSGNEDKRPESIEVQLLKDGQPNGNPVTLNEKNKWKHQWTNLSTKSEWSIEEVSVPENYTAMVTKDGKVITLTNTYVPPDNPPDNPDNPPEDKKVSYTAKKVWDDKGYESKRPKSVEVQLLKDGKQYDKQTLNEANGWTYTWNDLDASATWEVKEAAVPTGYDVKTIQDGTTVTVNNSYNPESKTTPGGSTSTKGKLPQTGMLWWPVPVLACAGLLLILLGLMRRNKRRNSDVE